MTTLYTHRLVVIIQASQAKVLNPWIRTNLDPQGDDWFTVPLNASGKSADPITHYWCCFAGTESDAKVFLTKLCQIANISDPSSTWDTSTKSQKTSWIASNAPTILSKCGIYIFRFDNDGIWDDPAKALATMGLQVLDLIKAASKGV